MMGRGHGSAFIALRAAMLLNAGAPAVATDPHPDNLRAIRACEKAGFARGERRDTAWGPAVLMYRYAKSASTGTSRPSASAHS
jgi:aminoglycoside 6'-N-acetyltransferase